MSFFNCFKRGSYTPATDLNVLGEGDNVRLHAPAEKSTFKELTERTADSSLSGSGSGAADLDSQALIPGNHNTNEPSKKNHANHADVTPMAHASKKSMTKKRKIAIAIFCITLTCVVIATVTAAVCSYAIVDASLNRPSDNNLTNTSNNSVTQPVDSSTVTANINSTNTAEFPQSSKTTIFSYITSFFTPSAKKTSDPVQPRSTTASPSLTPDASPSLTPDASPSLTPDASPSLTPDASPSLTPDASPSLTPDASPSLTPDASPSLTPDALPSLTPDASPSLTQTATPSLTPDASPSLTQTATPSITPAVTPTAAIPDSSSSVLSSSEAPFLPSVVTQTATPDSSSNVLLLMPSITPTVTPAAAAAIPASSRISVTPAPSTNILLMPFESVTPTATGETISSSSVISTTQLPSVTPTEGLVPVCFPSASAKNSYCGCGLLTVNLGLGGCAESTLEYYASLSVPTPADLLFCELQHGRGPCLTANPLFTTITIHDYEVFSGESFPHEVYYRHSQECLEGTTGGELSASYCGGLIQSLLSDARSNSACFTTSFSEASVMCTT